MNSHKKLTIKAVFLDVDGTLISFKTNKIPESAEQAIKSLRDKGVKVIVATGRSINSLDHSGILLLTDLLPLMVAIV
jgi:hydroxymethylpyrimidine pyrophosphatase-like HAD family hydrolase